MSMSHIHAHAAYSCLKAPSNSVILYTSKVRLPGSWCRSSPTLIPHKSSAPFQFENVPSKASFPFSPPSFLSPSPQSHRTAINGDRGARSVVSFISMRSVLRTKPVNRLPRQQRRLPQPQRRIGSSLSSPIRKLKSHNEHNHSTRSLQIRPLSLLIFSWIQQFVLAREEDDLRSWSWE